MQALLFALALLLLCSIVEGGVLGWLRRLLEGRRGPVFVDDKADTYKDEKIKELKSEILILTDQLREMKRILNSNKDMTNQGRREKMILQKQYEGIPHYTVLHYTTLYYTTDEYFTDVRDQQLIALVRKGSIIVVHLPEVHAKAYKLCCVLEVYRPPGKYHVFTYIDI